MADMGEWSEEELRLLEKAMKKYPIGTKQRWEQVAAYVRTRTPEEVVTMVKVGKEGGASVLGHVVLGRATSCACRWFGSDTGSPPPLFLPLVPLFVPPLVPLSVLFLVLPFVPLCIPVCPLCPPIYATSSLIPPQDHLAKGKLPANLVKDGIVIKDKYKDNLQIKSEASSRGQAFTDVAITDAAVREDLATPQAAVKVVSATSGAWSAAQERALGEFVRSLGIVWGRGEACRVIGEVVARECRGTCGCKGGSWDVCL